MRASLSAFLCLVLLPHAGCKLLSGIYTRANHFPLGTAAEQPTSQSVRKAATTMEMILRNKDFTVTKSTKGEEAAQIWAQKQDIEYVVDIKGGEQGSVVHLESEQAGHDAEIWAILHELKLYP